MTCADLRPTLCLSLCLACAALDSAACRAADSVRSQAVVNLTFDEAAGDARDSAEAGTQKDAGKLIGGPQRVESPFWGQQGRRAMLFEAPRNQLVQVADGPDVDRPEAVSLSFFFLNLQNPDDEAARGIVAKRTDKDRPSANYGINFVAKRDMLQVYVNDGGGFRVATYSGKNTIGSRRRVFLTATYEIGDAPDADSDGDRDDVRIRLFVNGLEARPTRVDRGTIIGSDAWLTDVKPDGLLNDVPLTLGSTNADIEHTSCLIDEFSLFAKALTPDEAAKLFTEVAGPNAAELARKELEQEAGSPQPQITAVSPRGLQAGTTTRITVAGQNLDPQPRVDLPIEGIRQTVLNGSNAGRLLVDVTVPADAPPGFYPLRVVTETGLTASVPVAVDRLPQRQAAESSAEKPSELPAAFSGTVSGEQQVRVYFAGKKGERVVADVEARRLGTQLDPVLEIKTERGTPLAITWGKVQLRGDARAELSLPADGLYFAELHDLEYRAPGQSPFRLKLGDLKLIDAWFPAGAASGDQTALEPVGTGLPAGMKVTAAAGAKVAATSELVPVPETFGSTGPAPVLRWSEAVEVIEAASDAGQLQAVDAAFAGDKSLPVVINGRISQPGEQDRYVLNVTPGQKLSLALDGRSIDSPLDGELSVLTHPQGSVQVVQEDRPGSRDPAFDYTVPANAKQIQVAVRDLHGRGGSHFVYRLRIAPAGRPDFDLNVLTPRVVIPHDGSALLEVQVNRSGYDGPIHLRLLGDDEMSLAPEEISAGRAGKIFVTLNRKGTGERGIRRLRLVGESAGIEPAIRRAATVSAGPGETAVPGFEDLLAAAVTQPVGLAIDLAELPPALFKGANAEIRVNVAGHDSASGQPVRLTLITTEVPRPVDPKDPKKGNKPLVRSLPGQFVSAADSGWMKLAVPFDVAQSEIEMAVRAELVTHPFSRNVVGTVYSRPVRLPLRPAASVDPNPKSLTLTIGATTPVRGTIRRTPGFTGSIDVSLGGLPKGYSAPKVTVPAEAGEFELPVTVPKPEHPTTLAKVQLSVRATDGEMIQPDRTIQLKVVPPTGPVKAPRP